MRSTFSVTRRPFSPVQGFACLRRIADAVKVQVGRRSLVAVIGLALVVAVVLLVQRTGTSVISAAVTPNWRFLLAGLAICAAVQPLRALAWTSTVRSPVGFRAMYTASSVGSFLDTVLPGRLGEASKVAVLKVTAGPRWPGFSRAGGSLLCAHLLEMIAFVLVGAASAFFLPVPTWAKITMLVGLPAAAGGLLLASVLNAKLRHRLPEGVGSFLAGAAVPKGVMLRAGAILVLTWVARWFGMLFLLHAVGVRVGVGVGVVGATGLVGGEMLRILEERAFPVGELRAYASARSEGRRLAFGVNVLVLPPGAEGRPHYHEQQDELYFVHSGRARFDLPGESRELGPGGLCHVESTTARQVTNVGDGELVLLVVGGKGGYVERDGAPADPAELG